MKQELSKRNINFLKDILMSKSVDLNHFKNNLNEFSFDEANKEVWNYIVCKSLELEYEFLLPLSNFLLEKNLCKINEDVTKYAVLKGFQIETGLGTMQGVLDQVNNTMNGFGFEEKLIVTNRPAENILNLAKKIVSLVSEETWNSVSQSLAKSNVDISKSKIKKQLKV